MLWLLPFIKESAFAPALTLPEAFVVFVPEEPAFAEVPFVSFFVAAGSAGLPPDGGADEVQL